MNHSHDLTAYLLGELSEDERAAIDLAVASDPELRAELESVRAMHEALKTHLFAEAGPEPRDAGKTIPFPAKKTPRRLLVFLGTPAGLAALTACVTLAAAVTLFTKNAAPERMMRAEATESKPVEIKTIAAKTGPVVPIKAVTTEPEALKHREPVKLPEVITTASPPAPASKPAAKIEETQTPPPAVAVASGTAESEVKKITMAAPFADSPAVASAPSFKTGIANGGMARGGPLAGAAAHASGAPSHEFSVDSISASHRGADSAGTAAPANLPAHYAVNITAGTPRDYVDSPLSRTASTRVLGGRVTGNRFDAGVTEQAYIKTADNALNTFSVDVSTASYAFARRSVNEGVPLAPEAVRIEEWLNNFSYAYPEPEAPYPVAAYVEGSDCPWNPEHKIVRIGLRAKNVPMENRPSSNLVFLIDTSGSMMTPDRLPLAQESLLKMLGRLDERDRVGIVTYAGNSGIAAEPTVCDGAGKKKLEKIILGLAAGGSTNGEAGLREAYALAKRHLDPEGVNRVILATDGDFNVGLSGTAELVEMAKREAGKKVFLTVLGFGNDGLNEDLMKQLSVKADGNHYYIDSLKEGERVLAQKLAGTIVTVARDVKIQIDFNPARVTSYRLIGYDTRRLANEDFNDDSKDAGEMGAGHTVTALYEIIPVGATPPVDESRYVAKAEAAPKPPALSDDWLTVKVRYRPVNGGKSTLIEKPLKADGMKPLDRSTPDQRFAAAVTEAALSFRNSAYKGSSDIAGALELLAQPGVVGEDKDRMEFSDLLKLARHQDK